MFKYIKKLTSVVLMFAVIIVFSTSKVYATTKTVNGVGMVIDMSTRMEAFSLPADLLKKMQVVGLVNNISRLTGLDLYKSIYKKRVDVDSDKVKKTDMITLERIKVLNLIASIGVFNCFQSKDINRLDAIFTYTMMAGNIGILRDIEKITGLKSKVYEDANKLNPLDVYNSFNGVVTAGFSSEIQLKAKNGKYYEAYEEEDGSYSLTAASLKLFMMDEEIAKNSGNNDSGGNDGM